MRAPVKEMYPVSNICITNIPRNHLNSWESIVVECQAFSVSQGCDFVDLYSFYTLKDASYIVYSLCFEFCGIGVAMKYTKVEHHEI